MDTTDTVHAQWCALSHAPGEDRSPARLKDHRTSAGTTGATELKPRVAVARALSRETHGALTNDGQR